MSEAQDRQVNEVSEKLKPKFSGADGEWTDEEVEEAVRDASEELRDAPVQTFVPLITENKARNQLLEGHDAPTAADDT